MLQQYGDEQKAIRWSRLLESRYADTDYVHHDPCTTMYRLVERLRELAEKGE